MVHILKKEREKKRERHRVDALAFVLIRRKPRVKGIKGP